MRDDHAPERELEQLPERRQRPLLERRRRPDAQLSTWGGERVGYSATTRINRKDFGLNWNQALETGGVLVGDQVTISVDLELVRTSD